MMACKRTDSDDLQTAKAITTCYMPVIAAVSTEVFTVLHLLFIVYLLIIFTTFSAIFYNENK